MKFLVDAQLPDLLAQFLQSTGYDTLHTKNLPQQNATSDSTINRLSIDQSRIVITKDSDFVNSLLTIQQPHKLLLVTTGNLKNSELEALFIQNLSQLVELFEQYVYIEMSRDVIVVHQ